MTNQNIRVKSIVAEGLFGMYNHEIILHGSERITVIHGPNGVGKTVMFKLTNAILSRQPFELLKYPFKIFTIHFTDNSHISAQYENITQIKITKDGKNHQSLKIDMSMLEKIATQIEKMTHLLSINNREWFDPENNETLDAFDIISRYRPFLETEYSDIYRSHHKKWESFFDKTPLSYMIEAQRLIKIRPRDDERMRNRRFLKFESDTLLTQDTVTAYSNHLSKTISDTITEYGKLAQKLDQTFPQRLFLQSAQKLTNLEIKERMNDVDKKQKKYQELGLIGQISQPYKGHEEFDTEKSSAMSIYIEDIEKKIGLFDNLAQRIDILLTQINSKFTNKQLVLDDKHQLIVKTDTSDKLSVSSLSSGEQHQIVLTYDMLFHIRPNTLVMIDEPELSLHVNWQERFLSDLAEVIKIADFDTLIATHSPYIINGRNDLMVSLLSQ